MGVEVESLKRDSCSFPTPMAYERSGPPQILILPGDPLPNPSASCRESISHTCRGYGGKIRAGEGSAPRFLLPEISGQEVCVVFWFLAGRRCQEIKARNKGPSGPLTHVADLMTRDVTDLSAKPHSWNPQKQEIRISLTGDGPIKAALCRSSKCFLEHNFCFPSRTSQHIPSMNAF